MLCRSISGLASRHHQWRPRPDRFSKLVAPVLDGHWDVPEDFKLIAARMATFESLSIHHTCCECRGTVCPGEPRDIGDEDIEEFLEEDSRAIEILHELLPEFEAKLAEMSCSFAEFMETYWKDRMVQVLEELNEPQPMTAHNLREIRHLGVNLQVEDNNDDETEPEYGSLEYYMAELDQIMEEVDV
ncbi:hypothetical protein CKAH01_17751 [Colletotrichum kahawae]|uniref:Uncharacterized protein n=1 Tax=Colletotrichum kahawae TaxID=34407 RepID=A0AAD9YAG1_COLKA|nr:hypothetical protein CKAH01_17751 [Colletotrichum kahawae]